jgi:hypothetical protein
MDSSAIDTPVESGEQDLSRTHQSTSAFPATSQARWDIDLTSPTCQSPSLESRLSPASLPQTSPTSRSPSLESQRSPAFPPQPNRVVPGAPVSQNPPTNNAASTPINPAALVAMMMSAITMSQNGNTGKVPLIPDLAKVAKSGMDVSQMQSATNEALMTTFKTMMKLLNPGPVTPAQEEENAKHGKQCPDCGKRLRRKCDMKYAKYKQKALEARDGG